MAYDRHFINRFGH